MSFYFEKEKFEYPDGLTTVICSLFVIVSAARLGAVKVQVNGLYLKTLARSTVKIKPSSSEEKIKSLSCAAQSLQELRLDC